MCRHQPQLCCHCGNSGFAASSWPGGVRRGPTTATNTPRSHSRPRRGFGHCDRTRTDWLISEPAPAALPRHDHVNCAPRPTVVERRSSHSIGESSRRRQALPNRSNPRYVPRWSRHLPAGAALGGRPVAGLPVARRDRPGRASSPPMSSLGGRVATGFGCWTPTPV